MPLLFLSIIVFESFSETRWIAKIRVVRSPEAAVERIPELVQQQV